MLAKCFLHFFLIFFVSTLVFDAECGLIEQWINPIDIIDELTFKTQF